MHASGLQRAGDAELIGVCNREQRIFITLDLGVSELRVGLTTGLVLLRPRPRSGLAQTAGLLEYLLDQAVRLDGSLTVVAPGRIRSRDLTDS